jgi:hypothetical protein
MTTTTTTDIARSVMLVSLLGAFGVLILYTGFITGAFALFS